MPIVKVPLGEKPYYNIDLVSKTESMADTCIDGFIDEAGTVTARQGIVEFVDTGTGSGGNGLFYWEKEDKLVAASGGKIWLITQDGGVSELAGSDISLHVPVSFQDCTTLDNSPWLYMTDGGYPFYTTGTDFHRLASSTGAPSAATHAVWCGGGILFNHTGTNKFYSNTVNPATGELDLTYFLAAICEMAADKMPDNISALVAEWDEVYIMGAQGCEVWRADLSGNTLYSAVDGTYMPVGLAAPYSPVKVDNTIYCLARVDGLKKLAVVKMVGRAPQVVSLPIEKVINSYSVVSDAIGFTTDDSQYILTFPTEKKTWCYDYLRDRWYPWTMWDAYVADRTEYVGRFTAKAWGKLFIQSTRTGKIGYMDYKCTKDFDDYIHTEHITGNITHGTYNRKQCDQLRLMLKCGSSPEYGAHPKVILKWRDNGNAEWRPERWVDLGDKAEREYFKPCYYMGQYRSRQYSVRYSGDAVFALAGIEEHIEVLSG